MSISLDDVNWFREVAKFGGISNASAHHDTMRSTVSRRIQTLEHQLGFELFTRHARGLELTSKGKELLKTVEESLDFLNRVINTTAQEHKGLSGTIRIALPSALMTMPLVMDTIKRFASSSPESSIEIENYQETLDLSKYSIDIQLLPASEPFLNVPEDDINLLTFNNYFVATKDYLDVNGTPNSLEELKYHRVITNRFDVSPKNRTMTSMRFPLKWVKWRSQHEKTLQRRTNYQGHQRA